MASVNHSPARNKKSTTALNRPIIIIIIKYDFIIGYLIFFIFFL